MSSSHENPVCSSRSSLLARFVAAGRRVEPQKDKRAEKRESGYLVSSAAKDEAPVLPNGGSDASTGPARGGIPLVDYVRASRGTARYVCLYVQYIQHRQVNNGTAEPDIDNIVLPTSQSRDRTHVLAAPTRSSSMPPHRVSSLHAAANTSVIQSACEDLSLNPAIIRPYPSSCLHRLCACADGILAQENMLPFGSVCAPCLIQKGVFLTASSMTRHKA